MSDDRFVREAREDVRRLSDGLVALEGSADRETVDDLFRTAHNLKGTFGMEGHDEASDLAHALEDLLDAVRADAVDPDAEATDHALTATDTLATMLDEIERDGTVGTDPEPVVETLRAVADEPRAGAESDSAADRAADGTDGPDAGTAEDPVVDEFVTDESVEEALDAASEFDDLDALAEDIEEPDIDLEDVQGGGSMDDLFDEEFADGVSGEEFLEDALDDDGADGTTEAIPDTEPAAEPDPEGDEPSADPSPGGLTDVDPSELDLAGAEPAEESLFADADAAEADGTAESADGTAGADGQFDPEGADADGDAADETAGTDGLFEPDDTDATADTDDDTAEADASGLADMFGDGETDTADPEAFGGTGEVSDGDEGSVSDLFGSDEDGDGSAATADAGTDGSATEPADTTLADDPDAEPDDEESIGSEIDFIWAKQSVDEEETSVDELQSEIEAESFGEFDDDDDMSIQELIDMEAGADEPGADATADEATTADDSTDPAAAEPDADSMPTDADATADDPATADEDDEGTDAPDPTVGVPDPADATADADPTEVTEGSDTAEAAGGDGAVDASADSASEEGRVEATADSADDEFDSEAVEELLDEADPATPADDTAEEWGPADTDDEPADDADTQSVVDVLEEQASEIEADADPLEGEVDADLDTDLLEEDTLDEGAAAEADVADTGEFTFESDSTLDEFEERFAGMFESSEDGTGGPTGAAKTIAESSLPAGRFRTTEERESRSLARGAADLQALTVEAEHADELLSVAERLSRHVRQLSREVESAAAEDTVSSLDAVARNLQRTVMGIRLMPLRRVTDRLPRVVRDVARETDTEAEVEIDGADIQLDRGVIERIGDPLVHLVRNAVDHGIERPEEREAVGKPETGTVEVRAAREGDDVTIEVADDGAGIDPDDVREAAVAEGVVTEDEAADRSDAEVFDLLFHPGLSTREGVTETSGRGVGMDVVRETVTGLSGSVDVESDPGEGTLVRLRIPVSVAVAEVLFVEAGGQRFALPTADVEHIGPAVGARVTDGGLLETAATADRTVELATTLGGSDVPAGDDAALVHVDTGEELLELRCSDVLERREVVITPYDDLLADVPELSGATTGSDGTLIHVLDTTEL